jgi:hypothetical protein
MWEVSFVQMKNKRKLKKSNNAWNGDVGIFLVRLFAHKYIFNCDSRSLSVTDNKKNTTPTL